MSSLLTSLGLRAAESGQAPPNHAVGFLLANWFLAYGASSTRVAKVRLGLDHNSAPREDLAKYGEAAVQAGKISRQQLNRLKRQEAAHYNGQENFTFFVAGVLMAVFSGVPTETINVVGLWYSVSRVLFTLSYVYIESDSLSFLRSVFWWSGNVSCITALLQAAKKL